MITLKAPIELKTRTDFIKDHESFGERIAGNYSLIGIEIGEEELLHIVNSPPEIYIAEGGATTIVGNTLISSRNEEKLDIINNMLNRIMLSVNTELSYQDRAYITDALYKIGIKDDRKFMNEVRRMMNESRLEEDFINDYLSVTLDRENEELRIETLELSREIVERGLDAGLTLREQSLSQNIMRRLQTGAIYQIVANFNKSLDETRINLAEQMISEQENIAKEMLVQNFLTEMVREGAEIYYREEAGETGETGPEGEQEQREGALYRESTTQTERTRLSETERLLRESERESILSLSEHERAELILREEAARSGEAEDTEGGATRESAPGTEFLSERERERYLELQNSIRESRELREARLTEREGAEIVYREGSEGAPSDEAAGNITERLRERIILREEAARRGEAEETEGGATRESEPGTEILSERERERYLELQNSIRESRELREARLTEREGAEIVYREGSEGAPSDEAAGNITERLRERIIYESRNLYERELKSGTLKETAVRETINAAVLYDIVKNLYHTGYERIIANNSWTEYRGALYRSSENTINRVSNTSYESNPVIRNGGITEGDTSLRLDYTEFEELSEIEENEGNIELIENQIRQMNETNLANVSRYEQMREILKQLTPERRTTGGRERTRREALMALEDEKAILQSLEEGEGVEEARRREVFHEISRLFPDSAAQVFNVIEQYLENPAAVQDMNIVSGNVAQAAEEIMRMQQISERAQEPEIPEDIRTESEELFFKKEERLTEDELTEILDSYRNRETRQTQDINNAQDISETRTVNSTTVTRNTDRNLTERELADIEDMVNRGVRSQMGAISEQVLTRLEKRLRNEKSRRGL